MLKGGLISRVFQILWQGHILLTYIVYITYITHYLHIDTCINMTTLHIATNITFTYIKTRIYHTCYISLAYIAF